MGLMATAREMSGPSKVKRGIGLLMLGALGLVVAALLTAADADAVIVVGIVAAWAALACGIVGLVLLIWGLLRD